MERREACLEMMSHGRADVGREVMVVAVVLVMMLLVLLVSLVMVLVVVGGGKTGVGSESSADITAWTVSAKSGYCSMVIPASACTTNAGLPDRNVSRDACFDAPAAFCGGRIVSAPASGFVRVHSLDFGVAKAALTLEIRAEAFLEAFLEAMIDGFVAEWRFCSSRWKEILPSTA